MICRVLCLWLFICLNIEFGASQIENEGPVPFSCADLLMRGYNTSGTYTVHPTGQKYLSYDVYCDQTTDAGGWTVFQRRMDGSVDFYRNWYNYKLGFGDLNGEFWLGNDKLYTILGSASCSELRIDMQRFNGDQIWTKYGSVELTNEISGYRLDVNRYNTSSTAGDSMSYTSGQKFSTRDRDQDMKDDQHCATLYNGAWWYKGCHKANLNGLYQDEYHDSYANGINWETTTGFHESLMTVEMKVRERNECISYPQSCMDILEAGYIASGIYTIFPTGSKDSSLNVYCDQTTDGGGWVVFQRRVNGSVDFYRNWEDYKVGFGDARGEFWLGNDNLGSVLQSDSCNELRIDMQRFEGSRFWAKYGTFEMEDENSGYRHYVSAYNESSDAGDSMSYTSGQKFSTRDRDQDPHAQLNCATLYNGAWWYKGCHKANLNGLYQEEHHSSYANGINWETTTGFYESLMAVEMKVRRKSSLDC